MAGWRRRTAVQPIPGLIAVRHTGLLSAGFAWALPGLRHSRPAVKLDRDDDGLTGNPPVGNPVGRPNAARAADAKGAAHRFSQMSIPAVRPGSIASGEAVSIVRDQQFPQLGRDHVQLSEFPDVGAAPVASTVPAASLVRISTSITAELGELLAADDD